MLGIEPGILSTCKALKWSSPTCRMKWALTCWNVSIPHENEKSSLFYSSLPPSPSPTYYSSSSVCCTSLNASASKLLISSLRYRAMKGIVLSSLKRRIMLAQTHSSIPVFCDKTCNNNNQHPANREMPSPRRQFVNENHTPVQSNDVAWILNQPKN